MLKGWGCLLEMFYNVEPLKERINYYNPCTFHKESFQILRFYGFLTFHGLCAATKHLGCCYT